LWPEQNEIGVLIHATALPFTGSPDGYVRAGETMRVDHNRSSYGAFPAFKRGFDSSFAALSACGHATVSWERATKAALLLRCCRAIISSSDMRLLDG